MSSIKILQGRPTRWAIGLSRFRYEVRHRAGTQMAHADALSRNRRVPTRDEQDWQRHVTEDPALSWIRDYLGAKKTDAPPDLPDVKFYFSDINSFYVQDGVVYRKKATGGPDPQKVVPVGLQERIIQLAHEKPTSAHLGVRKTTCRVTTEYYFHDVKKKVREYCRKCKSCALVKTSQRRREHLGTIPVLGKKFQQLSTDILKLPESSRGHKYVCVISDLFSKFAECYAIREQSAETAARCMVD